MIKVTRSGTSLSHSGIKGQKWGVRRFENEDGTLTPAGKERYYGGGESDATGSAKKQQFDSNEIAKQAIDAGIRGGTAAARDSVEVAKKIAKMNSDKMSAKQKQNFINSVKKMSSENLEKKVKRLNLENRYINEISQQQVGTGKRSATEVLDIIGGVTGIVAGAATTAVTIAYLARKAKG